jgi:hypothetical protein
MQNDLRRYCALCGAVMDEVLAYPGPVRAGWLCASCWPQDGSWVKAIGRERAVK